MILFNWEKILRVSNGNVGDIISILRIITYKLPPKNFKDKTFKFYQHNYGGKSFLLNPETLLTTGIIPQLSRLCSEKRLHTRPSIFADIGGHY